MVEIFKIFLPCTTRARVGSLRIAPALYLSTGDAGEHGGRYIFLFWNHEAYVSRRLHRFLMNRRNSTWWIFSKSVGTLVPKVSLSSFCYIRQLYLSRKTSKTTTRKATREKKTSDADASVSDTLTLIDGYLNDHEIQSYWSLALHLLNICCIATRLENFFPGYNGEEFMSKVYIYIYANGIHGFCFSLYWIDVVARLSIPMAISQQISLLAYKDLLRLTV